MESRGPQYLQDLLRTLRDRVEFKVNNSDPKSIGEYISALANSAALHERQYG